MAEEKTLNLGVVGVARNQWETFWEVEAIEGSPNILVPDPLKSMAPSVCACAM